MAKKIQDIAYKTLPNLIKEFNKITSILYNQGSSYLGSSVDTGDRVLLEKGDGSYKRVSASLLSGAGLEESQMIKEWAQGKDYEPTAITRDTEGRVTTMTVVWPDDSPGVYTATDYNATHEVYDGFTITHTASGQTVTQAAVTRNTDGAIINKPILTVA